jgi:hypothetical protein
MNPEGTPEGLPENSGGTPENAAGAPDGSFEGIGGRPLCPPAGPLGAARPCINEAGMPDGPGSLPECATPDGL